MRRFTRSFSLALAALLLVLVAGPVAAVRCRMSGYCPMMAMMAKAARPAPCPAAGDAMSAPMGCCRPQAIPAGSAGLSGLAPTSAVLAAMPSGTSAVSTVPVSYSRAGTLHPLGLFTLHSVWRI